MKLSEKLFWFARHNDVSAVFQLHKLPHSALDGINRVESTSGINCASNGAKILSLGIRTAVWRSHVCHGDPTFGSHVVVTCEPEQLFAQLHGIAKPQSKGLEI